ncbi:hypothetical protein V1477_016284, partial [Vespula maculifrons]
RVSEVPRGILSSLGFCTLAVIGRQVAYHFLCDCVFNFKQVGPDDIFPLRSGNFFPYFADTLYCVIYYYQTI